jgi:hypothetical protein
LPAPRVQKALSLKLTPAHVFRPTERYEVQIKLTASRPGVMHPTVLFTFRSPQGVEFKISQLVVVSVKDANSDPALEPTSPYVKTKRRRREDKRPLVDCERPERTNKVRIHRS